MDEGPPVSLQPKQVQPTQEEQLRQGSLASAKTKHEHIIITQICATDVVSGLLRIPAGFYVAVQCDGKVSKTSNRPTLPGKDEVEWDDEIILPSERSSTISFSVYATFELGPTLGNGELLRQFTVTVGELLDSDQDLRPIRFPTPEGQLLPSCSSFRAITERRVCDIHHPPEDPDVPGSDALSELKELTDRGHGAFLRYRQLEKETDLEEAFKCFGRARDICPSDHPNRSTVLFNLAKVQFVQCQAGNYFLSLDTPVALYREAFQLRANGHPDHIITGLDLGLALLVRFQKQGNEADGTGAKEFLSGTVKLASKESSAHRAACLALRMAEVSLPIPDVQAALALKPNSADPDPKELMQRGRAKLLYLSRWDSRRPKVLAALGILLNDEYVDSGKLVDLQEAISMMDSALELMSDEDPERGRMLVYLGIFLMKHFKRLGNRADQNKGILMLEAGIGLTPDGHPDKSGWLNTLGDSLQKRFQQLGDIADINKSVSTLEMSVSLTPNNDPLKPSHLNNLSISLWNRFQKLGDVVDINKSVSMLEEAVDLTPNGHSNKPMWMSNLARSLQNRFKHSGDPADMNKSILVMEEVVNLIPNGHPEQPSCLNGLGILIWSRFEKFNDVADVNRAITIFEKVVSLIPDNHPDKPDRLSNLGNSLLSRFKQLGDMMDINNSISMLEEAVRLTPDTHLNKPKWLNSLGDVLQSRFEQLGDVADMNKSVSVFEEAVKLTFDGHPDKPGWLTSLGKSLLHHFDQSGDIADINKAISLCAEAVNLTPDSHSDYPALLHNLGKALLCRFEELGDVADINNSVSILLKVVKFSPTGHASRPSHLNSLGKSLRYRCKQLGSMADIIMSTTVLVEAVSLTPESDSDMPHQLNNLANSLLDCFKYHNDVELINKAVSMLEMANDLTSNNQPDKPFVLSTLGNSLQTRFEQLGDMADMEKSILMLEKAVSLTSNKLGYKPTLFNNLGIALHRRFERLGDMADMNKAILMFEEAVTLSPIGHGPAKLHCFNNLGNSLCNRFKHLGDIADVKKSVLVLEEAVNLTPNNHPDKSTLLNSLGNAFLSYFEKFGDISDLDKSILALEEAISLSSNSHPSRAMWFNNLGSSLLHRFVQLGDIEDINKSISMFEKAIEITPNGHPDKLNRLNNLSNSLRQRFKQLGDKSDLTDVIRSTSVLEDVISHTPNGHPDKANYLRNLGTSKILQFVHGSHDKHVLSGAITHLSEASQFSVGKISIRFDAAHQWILSAYHQENQQSILDAYTTSINLLPQLVWIGLPLAERHHVLLDAAHVARDAVTAAVESDDPEMAVEWLEQGRSIVWTQLLQLRTPVDELSLKHPDLAKQFHQVCGELEHAGWRDDAISDMASMDKLNITAGSSGYPLRSQERAVQRFHDLAIRRDILLKEIHSLPGFDQFLLPRKIKQLSAFSQTGPVVYLNASKYRCDALIVMAELDGVIHVPLSSTNFGQVQYLLCLLLMRSHPVISRGDISAIVTPNEDDLASQQFLDVLLEDDSTREGVKIEQYNPENRFRLILAFLWKNVVNPVLQALGISTPPSENGKLVRMFWCPTGPFAFLPIHAAGIYGTVPGPKLSDFVISSYIPTLTSLGPPTRKDSNDTPSKIRLVTVPQPPRDGQEKLPSVRVEMDHIKTLSAGSEFVTLQESQGTVEDVMEKMVVADWVHFACHGVQDRGNPLDSGLCLADERLLKLSDIIRLSRPQGGLAFLSACQTATGDEKLSEESVHLAAGMLLAGYGSVIATMWSIMDRDAPKVTKMVYEHLFRDSKVPDTTESAEALHYAVRHLHESGAPFSSWVPFIHFGR